jgi:hypothetical protein
MTKVKRTYNLRRDTIDTVKRLVEIHVAPTQDAVVERAVREFARRLRDEAHTRVWAQAARDPEFQAELQGIWDDFAADDRAAWDVV